MRRQLFSVSLATSLLAVGLATAALRTPRGRDGLPRGERPTPSGARTAYVYVSATFSYIVALILVAALAAGVTGTVGAKGAELVAGYGADLTSQVRVAGARNEGFALAMRRP